METKRRGLPGLSPSPLSRGRGRGRTMEPGLAQAGSRRARFRRTGPSFASSGPRRRGAAWPGAGCRGGSLSPNCAKAPLGRPTNGGDRRSAKHRCFVDRTPVMGPGRPQFCPPSASSPPSTRSTIAQDPAVHLGGRRITPDELYRVLERDSRVSNSPARPRDFNEMQSTGALFSEAKPRPSVSASMCGGASRNH